MTNNIAQLFDAVYTRHAMYYGWKVRDEFAMFCSELDLSGKQALDLGCGEGRYAIYLAERGCQVTAVDLSQVGLAHLRQMAQARALPITPLYADLAYYDFPQHVYDLIVAPTILDHLATEGRQRVIAGIIGALKPGGIAYVSVLTTLDPGYQRQRGGTHARTGVSDTAICIAYYFAENELRELFSALQVLYYYEGVQPDLSHGTPHAHGRAILIARKA